jgi:alpha-galactosidase
LTQLTLSRKRSLESLDFGYSLKMVTFFDNNINRPIFYSLSLFLLFLPSISSLNNGAAIVSPRGYTTWQYFNFNVSDSGLRYLADSMVQLGLVSAGYDILWLDDGWPACLNYSGISGISSCSIPSPREANGSISVDMTKFPYGIKATFDYIHSRGIKVGIYTAPHYQTCGGYTGSLHFESIDAIQFAAWGVDAVKLDAGCRDDCSLHDGCLLSSLTRMRDGLNATGRIILYYIDDGNPTSGPRVYNQFSRGYTNSTFYTTHIARQWTEEVVSWGPQIANMYKLWFDREDKWHSLLDNVHIQNGFTWFQASGQFLAPDQMTIGQGRMSLGQYRVEVYLYTILSSPAFLSCDPRILSTNSSLLSLITNPELREIHQDTDCIMATKVSSESLWLGGLDSIDRWAVDIYVKPMSDNSWVFLAINRDPLYSHIVTFSWGDNNSDGGSADTYPANLYQAKVRDVGNRIDLGNYTQGITNIPVDSLDGVIYRIYPF